MTLARRSARAAVAAVIAACGAAPSAVPADAAPPITHTAFVEAYVACNNAAWPSSREHIHPAAQSTMADRMRGIDSAAARGFVGENLYYGGVWGDFRPREPATVGWALATKAFADRGEVLPRFRTRAAALAYVRPLRLRHADTLEDRAAGAVATELYLSRAAAGKYAVTPLVPDTDLAAPLTVPTARAMLAKIGSHIDVARKIVPKAGAACPRRVLGSLFGGAR